MTTGAAGAGRRPQSTTVICGPVLPREVSLEALIVTYGNEGTIEATLESLSRISGIPVGVAIHDNSPNDATAEAVARYASTGAAAVRFERCGGNCGFAAAANSLAASSRASHLLLLNPDAAVVAWPGAGLAEDTIVGPRVLDPNGRLVPSWGGRRTVWSEAVRTLPGVGRVTRSMLVRMLRLPGRRLGFLSGVALIVPAARFRELGGFDESFFLYYEDVDLSDRARRAGIALVVDEGWVITHAGAHSSRNAAAFRMVASYSSGRAYFARQGKAVGYDRVHHVNALLRAGVAGMRGRPEEAAAYEAVRHAIRDARPRTRA
jgi:N-acetylglucosaminyl-diphospho-decaprenol L-rhamnosyltransferase